MTSDLKYERNSHYGPLEKWVHTPNDYDQEEVEHDS